MPVHSFCISTVEKFCWALLSPLLLCKNKTKDDWTDMKLASQDLDDKEIDKRALNFPKVDCNTYYMPEFDMFNGGKIARVTPDSVTKPVFLYGDVERQATNMVRTYTHIPVPFCQRVVKGSEGDDWLIQQYIPGRTLGTVWPLLGWWGRFRVVLTVRYYVYQLRTLSPPAGIPRYPGPYPVDGKPQVCNGRLFTEEGPGPFSVYHELTKWYMDRLLFMQQRRNECIDTVPFDDSQPLVFTHFDLHPLNFIMGDDGQLWLIDWQNAGWYPPWFEAASTKHFSSQSSKFSHLQKWVAWVPFMVGTCERPGQLPFIRAIGYTLGSYQPDINFKLGDQFANY